MKIPSPGPSPPLWEILHLIPALMQSMTLQESGKILPRVLYGSKLYGNFQDFSSFVKYPKSTAFHERKKNKKQYPLHSCIYRFSQVSICISLPSRPVKPHPAVTQSDVPQISHDFGNTNHQHPIAMRKKHRHHKKMSNMFLKWSNFQGSNICHLWKRKHIFNCALGVGYLPGV